MLHHHNRSSVSASSQFCNSVTAGSSSQSNSRGSDMLQWQRPSSGWWKCNVDASLAQNSSYTGWG
ncbi:hypothetical protein A2U01_0074637, partial [Trifolium medium]|nr:hypothetical protein [Trifolium medium]